MSRKQENENNKRCGVKIGGILVTIGCGILGYRYMQIFGPTPSTDIEMIGSNIFMTLAAVISAIIGQTIFALITGRGE